MKVLRTALEEIVGLFVDDWRFAGLLVVWVGVGGLLARQAPMVSGPIFFAGLAVILLTFVYVRAARP